MDVTPEKKTIIRNNQLIVFKLGNEEFGLLIDQIKEVVITPPITKVPLSPSYIRGVANIRGNIIAIVDLEERFGLKRTISNNQEKPNYSLVVESEEYKMGILVNDVPNTLAIATEDIEQTPNVISDQQSDRNYIKGIVKIQNRLIILIDIYKIIEKGEIINLPYNSN